MGTATAEAAETPSRVRREGFRLDVQGLRAVAVLLVVLYHADIAFPGGFVGVDVFFVLSGYVIARTLRRELEETGRIDLREFYARRVRRLLPALALVSTVTVLVALVVMSPTGPQELAARTGLAASLFAGNLYLFGAGGDYFAPADELNPFLHTWSLSVEEQFYLLLPVTLVLTWRLARRSGRLSPCAATVAVTGAAAGLSLWASWALTAGRGPGAVETAQRFAFYSPVTRMWELMAGVLLALVSVAPRGGARQDGAPTPPRLGHRWGLALGLAGAAAVAWAATNYDSVTPFPGLAAVLPVGGTVLLLVAGRASPWVAAPLSWRPLVRIGDLSYGWYLWHWPAIVFTRLLWPGNDLAVAAVAFGSLVPAWLSYRWVESPVRRNRSLVGRRAVGLALVCIAVPTALAGGVLRGAASDWGLELPPEWRKEERLAVTHRCLSVKDRPWPADDCTFPVDGARGTVLLLGDSHATSAGDAVVGAAHGQGYDAAIWTRPGCPFLEDRPSYGQEGCAEWQRAALALVAEMDPALVVVANRSSGYTLPTVDEDDTFRTITVADGGQARTRADALASWGDALDDLLTTLGERGTRTLLWSVGPEYPNELETAPTLLRPSPPVPTLTRERVEARRGAVVEVEREVAARHDQVWTFDPVPALCPDRRCRPFDGQRWLYKDNHHLNAWGSRSLIDPLQVAMARALDRAG